MGALERAASRLVSPHQKYVLEMVFMAGLNWADFISDWLVVLQRLGRGRWFRGGLGV